MRREWVGVGGWVCDDEGASGGGMVDKTRVVLGGSGLGGKKVYGVVLVSV